MPRAETGEFAHIQFSTAMLIGPGSVKAAQRPRRSRDPTAWQERPFSHGRQRDCPPPGIAG
jgi:hypothetical protein